jgi:hypothetical protein
MVVAMPGKCVRVRLRHDLAGGVVNEDALNLESAVEHRIRSAIGSCGGLRGSLGRVK